MLTTKLGYRVAQETREAGGYLHYLVNDEQEKALILTSPTDRQDVMAMVWVPVGNTKEFTQFLEQE